MTLRIISKHDDYKVNVSYIINRILKHLPKETLSDLKIIALLDKCDYECFACYKANERRIEIYLAEILEWQPWIVRKTFIVPYLTIGLALGHELDHHVNRNNFEIDREASAEWNAFFYIYPSLGIFRYIINILRMMIKAFRRIKKRTSSLF